MPFTAFQLEILAVLAANRSEESHFAGGVSRASTQDVASLRAARFQVEEVSRAGEWERETTFRRATVTAPGGEVVEIDWAAESAFRFFPIERDPQLGWRLHLFDAATNKALTLASRTETRDYA